MRLFGSHKHSKRIQSHPSDCGFHCISVVAELLGLDISVSDLTRTYGATTRGLSLRSVRHILSDLGFSVQVVKFETTLTGELRLPAIALWKGCHYVVIAKYAEDYSEVYDPDYGTRRIRTATLIDSLDGLGIEVLESPEASRFNSRQRVRIREYFQGISALAPIAQLVTIAIVAQAAQLMLPVVVKQLFDRVAVGYTVSISTQLLLTYVVVSLFATFAAAMRNWGSAWLTSQLNVAMSSNLMVRLLDKPISYFERSSPTTFQMKFVALDVLRDFAMRHTIGVVLSFAMAIFTFFFMINLDLGIAFLALATLGLSSLTTRLLHPKLFAAQERAFDRKTKHLSFLQDALESIQAIVLYRVQSHIVRSNTELLERRTESELSSESWTIVSGSAKQSIEALDRLAFIGIAALAMGASGMTFGGFLAISLYREMFRTSILKLVGFVQELNLTRIYRERIDDVFEADPSIERDPKTETVNSKNALEVSNLSFRYASYEPWVLEDFSMEVRRGESVALVGATGSGKTTVVKLILGLLEPERGTIRVNPHKPGECSTSERAPQIGTVMQSDNLLTGTIEENIVFFRGGLTSEDAVQAARCAQLHEEIMAMPMQYRTIVSDRFGGLSGGQRQRLFIARAICGEPSFLILDESTSNLDIATERRVAQNISKMKMTRLVIAHRPETIDTCDRVISLDSLG